uniref:Si:dkeyp-97e7.9 n=1 Tax=Cyprinus carpio TaxID=7962 RepID=A0A8C1S7G0_CYPCA
MELLGNIQSTMMTRHQKAEVMIAGEQLRLRLHDSKLIKDRRHHLRTYPNCFVAQELIDWLIVHKEVSDRETAVQLMQHLMDHDIIHHGTLLFTVHQITKHVIQQGHVCFPFLLQNGEIESRREGLDLCKALLKHGIIQHVSLKHHFFDSGLLYQFCINFRRRRRLSELLHETENEEVECIIQQSQEDQAGSPEGNSDFLSVQPTLDGRCGSLTHLQQSSRGYPLTASLTVALAVRCNPTSVLKRHVTCEELFSPGAPYVKRVLTILGDALGWGFVVRGKSPCYVQAVDPASPAAAAGIKVRQFVCRVNGHGVLHLDYHTLSKLVMTGPRVVTLEVMEPLD